MFARGLNDMGIEIVASGGTAAYIGELGIDVVPVEELTDVPELLGGRVKTLHPRIHAGILARRGREVDLDELREHGIRTFDLVCVNLYPFQSVTARRNVREEDAVEMIDIGGPALLRAAAKNFVDVVPVCETGRYGEILDRLRNGRRRPGRPAGSSPPRRSRTRRPTRRRSRRGSPTSRPSRRSCSSRSSGSTSSSTARTRTSAPPTTRRPASGAIFSRASSSSAAASSRSTTSTTSTPRGRSLREFTLPCLRDRQAREPVRLRRGSVASRRPTRRRSPPTRSRRTAGSSRSTARSRGSSAPGSPSSSSRC